MTLKNILYLLARVQFMTLFVLIVCITKHSRLQMIHIIATKILCHHKYLLISESLVHVKRKWLRKLTWRIWKMTVLLCFRRGDLYENWILGGKHIGNNMLNSLLWSKLSVIQDGIYPREVLAIQLPLFLMI